MGFKIDGEYGYIDAGDMSANLVGQPINLASHLGIALQCDFSGVPSGVIKIQASCDLTQDEGNVINWTNIYELNVAGAGNKIFNCRNIYYKWIRLVYEATAGSGTLAVNYTVKGEW